MDRTTFSLEVFGDRLPLSNNINSAGDNRLKLNQLQKYLSKAIDTELTDRQKEIIKAFFYDGSSVTEISTRLGINKSTVSRHLKRSKEKLHNVLKYGIYPLWYD
ncbi:MAG: sigma-70 family RNA polymerase sigma factor [bacterium]|nr:sigma-70 family RNA polymerase sigma factor [bacterium]